MLLITAGKSEIVTVNTMKILTAYTDIWKMIKEEIYKHSKHTVRNIARKGMTGAALTFTVLRIAVKEINDKELIS